MSDVVNLNKFRKKKARGEKEKQAGENRAKHGLSKAEKAKYRRDMEKLASHIDGAKIDGKDDS